MKAHELIDKPEKWCQGTFARDKNGLPVSLWRSDAVAFCARGALLRAYWRDSHRLGAARTKLCSSIGSSTVLLTNWNDTGDWQTVYSTLKELDI